MTREEMEAMGLSEEEMEALTEVPDEDEHKQIGELMDDEDGEDDSDVELDDEDDEDLDQDDDEYDELEDDSSDDSEDEDDSVTQHDATQRNANESRDFDAEYAAIDETRSSLEESYLDGSLDEAEYREQLRQLSSQERSLIREQTKHDLQQEQHNAHLQEVAAKFLSEHADYKSYPARLGLLQEAANRIERDCPTLSPRDVLDKAHGEVCASLGIEAGAPAQKKKAKKGAEDVIPPTLGGVPSATNDNGDNSLFARLDKLTGDKLEDAMDKLSPDQRERYLEGR